MKTRVRALLTCLAFLLVVGAMVGSAARLLDTIISAVVCAAFLVGSGILLVKTYRKPGFYVGQLPALPRNWQRWILDEHDEPPSRDRMKK